MARKHLFGFIAVVLSLLVGSIAALGLFEIYVRLTFADETSVPDRWVYRLNSPPAYQLAPYYSEAFVREQMRSVAGFTPVGEARAFLMKDVALPNYNVSNGYRRTTDAPADPQHRVMVFGGSTIFGQEVPDAMTVPSFLQRLLLGVSGNRYLVENKGIVAYVAEQQLALLESTDVKPGDVVVFYDGVNDVGYGIGRLKPQGWYPGEEHSVRQLSVTEKFVLQYFSELISYSKGLQLLAGRSPHYFPAHLKDDAQLQTLSVAMAERHAAAIRKAADFTKQKGAIFLHILQPQLFSSLREISSDTAAILSNFKLVPPGFNAAYAHGYAALQANNAKEKMVGIRSVDLSGLFRDQEPSRIFLDYCHVNHVGNELVAIAMAKLIKEAVPLH